MIKLEKTMSHVVDSWLKSQVQIDLFISAVPRLIESQTLAYIL